MRGKVSETSTLKRSAGITPAHAGKSLVITKPMDCVEDHPRTCGEKMFPLPALMKMLGSPPHMQGKEIS